MDGNFLGAVIMDIDDMLLLATLGAVFPYMAVAAGDWISRLRTH